MSAHWAPITMPNDVHRLINSVLTVSVKYYFYPHFKIEDKDTQKKTSNLFIFSQVVNGRPRVWYSAPSSKVKYFFLYKVIFVVSGNVWPK